MNKYEEAAFLWNDGYPLMKMPEGYLSSAFRWRDEQRDKETCETCDKGLYCPILGAAMVNGIEILKTFHCSLHTEKESK